MAGLLLIFEDRTEHVQLARFARHAAASPQCDAWTIWFEAIAVFAADGRLHLWNSKFRQIWSVQEALLTTHPRVDGADGGFVRPALRARSRPASSISSSAPRLWSAGKEEAASLLPTGAISSSRRSRFPMATRCSFLLDISDSRRIEQALRDRNEALEDADRVKTAFVSNMS